MHKVKISKVLLYYMVILLVFPIVSNNIFTVGILGVLFMMWAFSNMKTKISVSKNIEYIFWLSEIVLLVFLYLLNSHVDTYISSRILFRLAYLFVFMFVFNVHIKESYDYRKIQSIYKFTLGSFIIVSITTAIGLVRFPMASRLLAGSAGEDSLLFQLNNIGGYGFIYSLCFLIPILVFLLCHVKLKQRERRIYILAIITMGITVVLSQYVIAIGLTAGFSVLAILVKKGKRLLLSIVGIGGSLVVIIFLARNAIYDLLYPIAQSIGNGLIRVRVVAFLDLLVGGNIDVNISTRYDAYVLSWEDFLNSPFIGKLFQNTPIVAHNHSEVLDMLACVGVLGSVLLIVTFILYFLRMYKTLKMYNLGALVIIMGVEFVALAILNTIFTATEVFVVISILLYGTITVSELKSEREI